MPGQAEGLRPSLGAFEQPGARHGVGCEGEARKARPGQSASSPDVHHVPRRRHPSEQPGRSHGGCVML